MENEEHIFFVCVAENKAVCLLCWMRSRSISQAYRHHLRTQATWTSTLERILHPKNETICSCHISTSFLCHYEYNNKGGIWKVMSSNEFVFYFHANAFMIITPFAILYERHIVVFSLPYNMNFYSYNLFILLMSKFLY